MIDINLAKTDSVFTYYYNEVHDMFCSIDPRITTGMKPTHKIVVDNTLYAQEIDKIFDELFK